MEENNPEEKDIDEGEFINEDHINKNPYITKSKAQIIISQLDKHICKIYVTETNIGTGFFCRIRYPDENRRLPVLITNNHVLNEKALEINHTIKITLEDDKIEKNILIDKSRLTFTDPDLDVTIIQIKPEDEIDTFLDVDENVFNKDYNKIYKKGTPIYLLPYPEGVFASHAVGRIDQILKEGIFHSCSTDPCSSGSPILLLSTLKVIAIHIGTKKEKAESNNLGIWIKYPIEEFNKKYPNGVKDNINPIKPIIFQKESIDKKITENSGEINNNNNNENNKKMDYLDKYKEDFEFNEKYGHDYLLKNNNNNINENNNFNDNNQNYQSNNHYNNNYNYGDNNEFRSNTNYNYNIIQQYDPNQAKNNNFFNNNNSPNFNQKREKNFFPIKYSNNTNSIKTVDVYICSRCFNQKICCLCLTKISSKEFSMGTFKAHSTCFEDHKCYQCRSNASSNFLNICKNCKNLADQSKFKGSICFICKSHL